MPDLGYTGILSGMINTDAAMAELDAQKQRNAINALALQQATRNADIEEKSRIAMQQEIARQAQAGASQETVGELSTGGLINEPPSLGGQPTPKLSDLHKKEYEKELGFAKAMAGAGNVKGHLLHQKAAEDALAKVKAAQTEERQQHKEKWKGILNIASAAFDQNSMNAAFATGRQQFGNDFDKYLGELGFAQLPDGQYAWDEAAKQNVKAIKELAVEQVQRVSAEDKDAKRAVDEARLAEQKRHNEAMEEAKRRQQQLDRDNADLRRSQQELVNEQRTERQRAAFVRSQQQTLNKDKIYSNWSNWEMGFETAQEFKDKLRADPNAFKNGKIQASQVYRLGDMFKSMKDAFRPQAGGRYQMQEIKQFNGAFDRFSKFYDSLGSGTPILSEDQARDLSDTMTEMYNLANKQAVLASFEAADRVNKKYKTGGEEIALKGNLQQLIRSGMAKQVIQDGTRYIQIGDKKFELVSEE